MRVCIFMRIYFAEIYTIVILVICAIFLAIKNFRNHGHSINVKNF